MKVNVLIKVMIFMFFTICLFYLYLNIIVGRFPKIEYAYNTIYSDGYSNKSFKEIKKGMRLDQLLQLVDDPIVIKEYHTNEGEKISVYYYSYMRKGKYIGKIGYIYGKIILIKNGSVVKIIDRIMPHTELMIKYISREEI